MYLLRENTIISWKLVIYMKINFYIYVYTFIFVITN